MVYMQLMLLSTIQSLPLQNATSGISIEIVVAIIGIFGIVIGGLLSKFSQAQFEKRKWKENLYNEYWQSFSKATMFPNTYIDSQTYAEAYSRLLLMASRGVVSAAMRIQQYRSNPVNPQGKDMNKELQDGLYRAMRRDLLGWWRVPNWRTPTMIAITAQKEITSEDIAKIIVELAPNAIVQSNSKP